MEVTMPILSGIPIEGRIGIVFSSSIAVFSSVQYTLAKTRNKLEDLRYEFENVYGPLFTLLSYYEEMLVADEKPSMNIKMGSRLNEIFRKYPHVFSSKLYDYWKETINTQTPLLNGENVYWVHSQFVGDFFEEYKEKVKSYRNLIGKKN